jgi:thiamine-monophosphate kinase
MMSGLDEFALIKRLFLPLAEGEPAALGLMDDVALIDGADGSQWVVTTDAIVAGVHFLADDPADLIARKLIRVNLSDLAAKGAEPCYLLLAACFPRDVTDEWLDRFASGLKSDCAHFKVALIGGDTVATPGPLTLSLTALGRVARETALLRSNARSGDEVWVSGSLGDAALGLLVAKGGAHGLSSDHADYLLDRYRLPRPRLQLGRHLHGLAHAAMDISDGLLADLSHICEASGCGAVIEAAALPRSPAAQAALAQGLGEGLASLAAGGDDYELLFTAPPAAAQELADLSRQLGLPLTLIGRITAEKAVKLLGDDGGEIRLGRRGYLHFDGSGG